MDVIDRDASGVDHVSGLTHETLMKADPVWAALRGEVSALQALVKAQRAEFNALLAKLDTNHGAATDHVATLAVTTTAYPDPAL